MNFDELVDDVLVADDIQEEEKESMSDGLTTEQRKLLETLPEENREAVKSAFLETNQIDDGTYWTTLAQLYETDEEPFVNGYADICWRIDNEWEKRPPSYSLIAKSLHDLVFDTDKTADDISLRSGHSSRKENDSDAGSDGGYAGSDAVNNAQKAAKTKDKVLKYKNRKPKIPEYQKEVTKDFLDLGKGNKAHLIPQAKSLCAPRYGIISQPIIGYSVEQEMQNNGINDLAKLKKLLQMSVVSDSAPKGLACLAQNLISAPYSGHEDYFDKRNECFFIPVMTLNEALNWDGEPYLVMVVVGDIRDGYKPENNAEGYRAIIPRNPLQKHRTLEPNEIRTATDLLKYFVKALADISTGRQHAHHLKPDDLDRGDKNYTGSEWATKAKECDDSRKIMENDWKVKVPKPGAVDWSDVKILGAKIEDHPLADPALLVLKAAINWMVQMGQRPVPACGPYNSDDSEDGTEYSDDEGPIGAAPSTPGIPEFVNIPQPVTPSPPRNKCSRVHNIGLDRELDDLDEEI